MTMQFFSGNSQAKPRLSVWHLCLWTCLLRTSSPLRTASLVEVQLGPWCRQWWLKGGNFQQSSSSLSGSLFWQTIACQREKNEQTCQVSGSLRFFWQLPSSEKKKQRGRYRAKITRSIPSSEALLQSVFVPLCLKEAVIPGSSPGQLYHIYLLGH